MLSSGVYSIITAFQSKNYNVVRKRKINLLAFRIIIRFYSKYHFYWCFYDEFFQNLWVDALARLCPCLVPVL